MPRKLDLVRTLFVFAICVLPTVWAAGIAIGICATGFVHTDGGQFGIGAGLVVGFFMQWMAGAYFFDYVTLEPTPPTEPPPPSTS